MTFILGIITWAVKSPKKKTTHPWKREVLTGTPLDPARIDEFPNLLILGFDLLF
jgi:hypothetical protein